MAGNVQEAALGQAGEPAPAGRAQGGMVGMVVRMGLMYVFMMYMRSGKKAEAPAGGLPAGVESGVALTAPTCWLRARRMPQA
jgi:hypothetical protein